MLTIELATFYANLISDSSTKSSNKLCLLKALLYVNQLNQDIIFDIILSKAITLKDKPIILYLLDHHNKISNINVPKTMNPRSSLDPRYIFMKHLQLQGHTVDPVDFKLPDTRDIKKYDKYSDKLYHQYNNDK